MSGHRSRPKNGINVTLVHFKLTSNPNNFQFFSNNIKIYSTPICTRLRAFNKFS